MKIIHGHCVEAMRKMPARSIDCVVTSPPYDDLRDYSGNTTTNLNDVGREIFNVLKPGGVVAVVMQDQTRAGAKSLTTFRMVVDWCDRIGFRLFECPIYRKHGAEGAWWNKRFRVDHEYIPLFLKGGKPSYFDKSGLMVKSKHGGKTMTGGGTRLTSGKRINTKPITINEMKCRGTVWEYLTCGDGSRLKHRHPATFPDKLPEDVIRCFCPVGGTVLDPFCGSGTTLVAAHKLGRKFIGVDVSADYCEIARARLWEERGVSV